MCLSQPKRLDEYVYAQNSRLSHLNIPKHKFTMMIPQRWENTSRLSGICVALHVCSFISFTCAMNRLNDCMIYTRAIAATAVAATPATVVKQIEKKNLSLKSDACETHQNYKSLFIRVRIFSQTYVANMANVYNFKVERISFVMVFSLQCVRFSHIQVSWPLLSLSPSLPPVRIYFGSIFLSVSPYSIAFSKQYIFNTILYSILPIHKSLYAFDSACLLHIHTYIHILNTSMVDKNIYVKPKLKRSGKRRKQNESQNK